MDSTYCNLSYTLGPTIKIMNNPLKFDNQNYMTLFINEIEIEFIKEAAICYSNFLYDAFKDNPLETSFAIELNETANVKQISEIVQSLLTWNFINISEINIESMRIISEVFDIPLLYESINCYDKIFKKMERQMKKQNPEIFGNNKLENLLENISIDNLSEIANVVLKQNKPYVFSHELTKACIRYTSKIELFMELLMKLDNRYVIAFIENNSFYKYFPQESSFVSSYLLKNCNININIFANPHRSSLYLQSCECEKIKEISNWVENYDIYSTLLRKDDADNFSILAAKNHVDLTKYRIVPSKNERISYINHENISFIEYSAFFGSIKCFKYLLMNCNIHNFLSSLPEYAVCSGNIEIIRLCEQHHCVFTGKCIENCVIYQHVEILSWLVHSRKLSYSNYYYQNMLLFDDQYILLNIISSKNQNQLAFESIKYNHYYLFKLLFYINCFDVNKPYKKKTFLTYASKYGNIDIIAYLLEEKGCNINQKDLNNDTALLIANKNGNTELVKFLLHYEDIDVNIKDYFKYTSLHTSIMKKNYDIVDLLLNHRNIFVETNSLNTTPIHSACKNGNIEIIEKLIKKSNKILSMQDSKKRTPLHILVKTSNYLAIQYLCEHYLDLLLESIKAEDNHNLTPFHYACKKGNCKIATILYQYFGNIVISNESRSIGLSMLYALNSHSMDIVRLLLSFESFSINDIIETSEDQNTLIYACSKNLNDFIQIILEHPKIDYNTIDYNGKTALHYAIENENIAIIEMLLQNSSNINLNIYDKYCQENSLHYASKIKDTHILRRILEANEKLLPKYAFDINSINKNKKTALHLAVRNNNYDSVCALLEQKEIDINAEDSYIITPIHIACQYGYIKILELLLERPEINVNIKDMNGFTPLHYACEKRNTEVVEILLKSPEIDKDVEDCVLISINFGLFYNL
ncbi:hypothetical protein TRFO_08746 [Tritrichomonas foetus]|uniref:Uncharacterized protein n=1 Tax=Tritrichomonas foetus TaxID=1144522 RepID=A0A1J4JK34_9EUKA|nr:hypothetical protein TRFO_08746 [Tritrichomonas foetus]|eukprot:OHS98735.1 hypothetical protein TRFO_08746 [Tritrichomonas foetus]